MTYKENLLVALDSARTLEDFDYIENIVLKSDKINRRTKQGRELTEEYQNLIWEKRQEAIIKYNILPF